MHNEQIAMERQNMQNEIDKLTTMLHDMATDWRECVRTGKSPCFYCAHDDTCTCTNDYDCDFKWQPHN